MEELVWHRLMEFSPSCGCPGGLPWRGGSLKVERWQEVKGKCKLCLKLLYSDVLSAQMCSVFGTELRGRVGMRRETPLLVNTCLCRSSFEEEAAVHTTLLQFSEFYKTTGGLVPVWTSRKCLRADSIMSNFFLCLIFLIQIREWGFLSFLSNVILILRLDK